MHRRRGARSCYTARRASAGPVPSSPSRLSCRCSSSKPEVRSRRDRAKSTFTRSVLTHSRRSSERTVGANRARTLSAQRSTGCGISGRPWHRLRSKSRGSTSACGRHGERGYTALRSEVSKGGRRARAVVLPLVRHTQTYLFHFHSVALRGSRCQTCNSPAVRDRTPTSGVDLASKGFSLLRRDRDQRARPPDFFLSDQLGLPAFLLHSSPLVPRSDAPCCLVSLSEHLEPRATSLDLLIALLDSPTDSCSSRRLGSSARLIVYRRTSAQTSSLQTTGGACTLEVLL